MPTATMEFTLEQEQSVAHAILALEAKLTAMLRTVSVGRDAMDRPLGRAGGTRHAAVDRIAEAIAAVRASKQDAATLARLAGAWDEAQTLRWRLALSAKRVAQREARRFSSSRVSQEDLEQEGVLGLLSAARRYDPDRGVRFAVYAKWWVRAQLTRAIQLAGAFQISATALELNRNLQKLLLSDIQAGVQRSTAALAKELGVDLRRLRDVMAAGALRSVDEGDAADGPSVIGQLPDRGGETPEDRAVDVDVTTWLRAAIGSLLVGRDRHIIESRYGINREVCSIAVIAESLSLSTERVRQLEQQCLNVLRGLFARELDV